MMNASATDDHEKKLEDENTTADDNRASETIDINPIFRHSVSNAFAPRISTVSGMGDDLNSERPSTASQVIRSSFNIETGSSSQKSTHGKNFSSFMDGSPNPSFRTNVTNRVTISDTLMAIVNQELDDGKVVQEKLELYIRDKVLKDESPEAKLGRKKMWMRAVYGDFLCALLYYTPIFCIVMHATLSNWGLQVRTYAEAFVSGFQALSICFSFSNISGAQFNGAVTFALWVTGKMSNRRCFFYITVQFIASILGMSIVTAMFEGDLKAGYDACAVRPVPGAHLGKVFATEFILTFILTYVGFSVAFGNAEVLKKDTMSLREISDAKGLTVYASTPQSRTGFAPFTIGFTIFCLSWVKGSSGGAFNPGRMFGPAIFSGKWDHLYLYFIAQFSGAAVAGLLVTNLHKFGLDFALGAYEKSAVSSIEGKMIATKTI